MTFFYCIRILTFFDYTVYITGEESFMNGGGTRDERGQGVLHFAASRPAGAQTILAFLQNPTVNLAWRDDKLRTARDVAMSLNRPENVKVSKKISVFNRSN